MAIKTTQDQRLIQLSTPLEKDFLLIERVRCVESLNQLFHIELDILHEEQKEGVKPTVVDPKKLLGNPMILSAHQPGPTTRYFHGICISFSQGARNPRFSTYRAVLVPKVWMLTQIKQSRIFQNKTVPQIIEEVLTGYEFKNEIQTQGLEPRNYCVQYRESDWDFISRLMEEEGIFYYFEHTKNNHKLILGNDPRSHHETPTAADISYALERSELNDKWIPSINQWRSDDKMYTGKVELRDYHFQLPTKTLRVNETSQFDVGKNRDLEAYDWPGGYAKRFDGVDAGGGERPSDLEKVFPDSERTVKIRQEEIDTNYKRNFGSGDCCAITAGYRFNFIDHPTQKPTGQVVITAEHNIVQSPLYISDEPYATPYDVHFACIPYGQGQARYRPPRKTPKPIVHGSQTAKVVGNPGDEIFTDKYGRVKVHFHWDRSDNNDQKASAWIRYGTLFAGNKWGSQFIPRVGQEVIVDFLEGDPDQPIIVGCVYNEQHMPHYELPKYKTLSYIKSHSTPKAQGFNEIRFEDKAKKEQVFMHSQKRYDLRVRGSMYETCGGNRQEVIGYRVKDGDKEDRGGNLAITVGGNYDLHVCGDQFIGIDKALYETVKSDVGEEYKAKHCSKITGKRDINAQTITLESLQGITLKVGASFVTVDLTGVTIQGPIVKINSGGAAMPTTPFQMADPLDAEHADTGEPGYLDRPRTGGGGGGRRWRTVDGYHAPVVRRNDDGTYQMGNIIVNEGTTNPNFQRDTLNDLAMISTTPEGQSTLNGIDSSGRTVTIRERPPNPTDPNNAETTALNQANATNGTGSDSTIDYDPTAWPVPSSTNPASRTNAPSDVILHHELSHGNQIANGNDDLTPRADCFTDNGEATTIAADNRYRDERGVGQRTDHKDF